MYCPSCNFDLHGLAANTCPECGRGFDPADASTFLARPSSWVSRNIGRIMLAIGLLIVLGVIGVGCAFYYGAKITMEAEERLQATRVIADLIAEHVERSPTHAWPTSWAELEQLPADGRISAWPKDAAKYKAIITIGFTATTAAVLKQSPASCAAVTVTPGPDFVGSPARDLEDLFSRLHSLADQGLIQPPTPRPRPTATPPPKPAGR